ncbi:MAG TPA: helix-turn-helix transcriptional regulator [Flavobacteriales bacterium]|nr:helix-turn-helix transcriptional regulator [Flavobacteriales bacterium]
MNNQITGNGQRMPPGPKIYLYKRIVDAKLYIDTHYASCINLNIIAGEAHFSKFHFIRLFAKIYGKTPHQYLISVRLEKAKALLQNQMPVCDTCLAVGFESFGSFSQLFSRNVGISPQAYMKQHEKRKKEIAERPLVYIPGCFAEARGFSKKISHLLLNHRAPGSSPKSQRCIS